MAYPTIFAVFGWGKWSGYVLAALAGVAIYPDRILGWVSIRTGKPYSWFHVLLIESAVILCVLALEFAFPSRTSWAMFVFMLSVVASIRLLVQLVRFVLGITDDR